MAGQNLGYVKPYTIDNAGGVSKYCCVVQGAEDDACALPSGQNVPGFLGVTVEAQPNQNKGVGVTKSAIFTVVAGGTITRGDRLAINSAAGDVYSIEAALNAAPSGVAKNYYVVGKAEQSAVAGDLFPMLIQDYQVIMPAS